MENDLFEDEQQIYDNAMNRIAEGAQCDLAEYAEITKEYGKLLKQLRLAARMGDRNTVDTQESNWDVTDRINYDALTGIYNRRYLEANLKRTIKTIVRSNGGPLSVLMIDIDFFKKYNDTYGYGQGDVCLKSVAKIIAGSMMKPDDCAARYGGGEFAVILPHTDASGARGMAEKILENVRACAIPHIDSEAADCVTVSVGVTTAYVDLASEGGDFIKQADEALYMSKGNGRNRYTYVDFREAKYEIQYSPA